MTATDSAQPISPELQALLLAFADDELCVGQNHAYWIAVSPFLEEDLAFTSIAQDELGHARALYSLLTDDVDAMAYGRQPREYRSAHMAEELCHDWSEALVRHSLYDLAERVRWDALVDSVHPEVAGVARRAAAEEQFHLRHAIPLLQRLLSTDEGRTRLGPLLQRFAVAAFELFELDADATGLVESGAMSKSLLDQRRAWMADVDDVLEPSGLVIQWPDHVACAGRKGERSAWFEPLHGEMVAVLALDPSAAW